MILLANGCSHTHGSETHSPDTIEENRQLAYPKFVADHFNMDYVNIACPACSNEYIVYSTLDWLAEHPNEDVFVLIGWTTFPRKTFVNKTGKYYWTPGSENPHRCWQSGKYHTDLLNYFKAWVANDCYGPAASEDFYHNIKYLNLELRSKNIKHLMVNAWVPWKHHKHNQRSDILNMPEFWLPESEKSTLNYHTDINNCKYMPGGHPEAAAHTFYAKEIIKVLEEGKVL